jgi:putative ATPase
MQAYSLISALHMPMRGSDVDAAIYWLERILQSGEEPFYIVAKIFLATV